MQAGEETRRPDEPGGGAGKDAVAGAAEDSALENAGLAFRRSPRLNAAVSEYLCDAVVVCASQTAVPAAHGLALCAFLAALKNFRHTLKAEIAVFFPALLLDPLEAGDATCASAGGFERVAPGAPGARRPRPRSSGAPCCSRARASCAATRGSWRIYS